jgi:hypothetical protein
MHCEQSRQPQRRATYEQPTATHMAAGIDIGQVGLGPAAVL